MKRCAEEIKRLVRPHIDAYNRLVEEGLSCIAKSARPISVSDRSGNRIRVQFTELTAEPPGLPSKGFLPPERKLLPSDCRQMGTTYAGRMLLEVEIEVNGSTHRELRHIGDLPIMVGSALCNIRGCAPGQMARHKEDEWEAGGYFIVNGIERIARLIQAPKRNLPFGIIRPSLAKRGPLYTDYGVGLKSFDRSGEGHTLTLHYLADYSVTMRVYFRKGEYLVPLILVLRALCGKTDKEVFDSIASALGAGPGNSVDRVELLLRSFSSHGIYSQRDALAYIGGKFRPMYTSASELRKYVSPSEAAPGAKEDWEEIYEGAGGCVSEEEYGKLFLSELVAPHLDSFAAKYNTLVYAAAKLLMMVDNKIAHDDCDTVMMHELVTVNETIGGLIGDKLREALQSVKMILMSDSIKKTADPLSPKYVEKVLRLGIGNVGKKVEYFLSTGNLLTSSGLDILQDKGFTVLAERLNFWRFLSHFRSVHRGAYFEVLKTTAVRKLSPESWGFLCPVHTPDGSPCGLLTHLSHQCVVTQKKAPVPKKVLTDLGMALLVGAQVSGIPVVMDGEVVGGIKEGGVQEFVASLRRCKVREQINPHAEICYMRGEGVLPTVFILCAPNRMVRPVVNIKEGSVEYVGTTEQVFLQFESMGEKALAPGEEVTHREISPTNILSVVAGLTPFANFNPSPRNMYQCQMGKQSMGVPVHGLKYRADDKLYRLDAPQGPIVRTAIYDHYGMEMYPNGQNAIVAIVSYTAYDMEDAVILNKASVERGFMRGTIYTTGHADPAKTRGKAEFVLGDLSRGDGLPEVGQTLRPREPMYKMLSMHTGIEESVEYHGFEEVTVDNVRIFDGQGGKRAAAIQCRLPRVPTIGDKFSSRHGQKGVCSILYPEEDMPFSEAGLTPDLIINPHAFPSRMSIGMFIESIAGKAGALDGKVQDGSIFSFGEGARADQFFGDLLEAKGFRRHGSEVLHSGVTGEELKVDVFFGVVYYQRLRHMVGDKYQIRTTGPVHSTTRQPIGGRKRAGGIRLGEMERDALISHGAAAVITDRMMKCSDRSVLNVCKSCNGLLCFFSSSACPACKESGELVKVAFPFVFKYLVAEFMAMNINFRVSLTDPTRC